MPPFSSSRTAFVEVDPPSIPMNPATVLPFRNNNREEFDRFKESYRPKKFTPAMPLWVRLGHSKGTSDVTKTFNIPPFRINAAGKRRFPSYFPSVLRHRVCPQLCCICNLFFHPRQPGSGLCRARRDDACLILGECCRCREGPCARLRGF